MKRIDLLLRPIIGVGISSELRLNNQGPLTTKYTPAKLDAYDFDYDTFWKEDAFLGWNSDTETNVPLGLFRSK